MRRVMNKIVTTLARHIATEDVCKYECLRIMPHTGNRNYNSSSIAEMISGLYRNIKDRVERIDDKLVFEEASKVGYYIEISCDEDNNKGVGFYMIVPYQYSDKLRVKMENVWKGCKVEKSDNMVKPIDNRTKAVYELKYSQKNVFSLHVDKRDTTLLDACLSVISALDKNEKVGIYYNFIPISQSKWSNDYAKEIGNSKGVGKRSNNSIISSIQNELGGMLQSGFDGLADATLGSKAKPISHRDNIVIQLNNAVNKDVMEVSKLTKDKRTATVLDAQIMIVASSDDRKKAIGNAKYVASCFNCIDGDNRLIANRIPDKYIDNIDVYREELNGITRNTISATEAHNFIQVPGNEILNKYRIKYNQVTSVIIPEEFLNGYLSFGYSVVDRQMVKVYVSTDKEVRCMPYILLGPQGCGKTTDLERYAVTCCNHGDCVVIIDFIKACELSKHVSEYVEDHNKILLIDLTKQEYYQSFAFNESGKYKMVQFDEDGNIIETNDIRSKVIAANQQCALMCNFIDSINRDEELTSTMLKGFKAMCNIVFLFDNTSLKDVVDGLLDFEIRHSFIDRVPEGYFEEVPELVYDIQRLEELDDYKDGEIVGTKGKLVDSAISRINRLMDNLMFRQMLFKNPANNIDFVEAMDSGKCILICMPQDVFQDETSRNILTTFFTSKVMFATKLRAGINAQLGKDNLLSHLIIDEPYQTPNILPIFKDNLNQLRKFRLKPVMSMHFINQLSLLVDYLDTAGASYSFYRGSIKADFEKFEEMLRPFTFESILNLPKWHALNLIKGVEGADRTPFITKHFMPIYEDGTPKNEFKQIEKERDKKLKEILKEEKKEAYKNYKKKKEEKELQDSLRKALEEEEKSSKKGSKK